MKEQKVVEGFPPNFSSEPMALVDPAGLHHIRPNTPATAGGASGAIYKWLNSNVQGGFTSFPPEVVAKFTPTGRNEELCGVGQAKLYSYKLSSHICKSTDFVHVIHTVGPNFVKIKGTTNKEAAKLLSTVYQHVFEEFALQRDLKLLRLLPVSGGIFRGDLTAEEFATITLSAVQHAYKQLISGDLETLSRRTVLMCLKDVNDYNMFRAAYAVKNIIE